MKKIIKTSVATTLTLLFTMSSAIASENKEHHVKHWGYLGDVGPSHWGSLNKKFNMCSEGKMQSPINVIATKKGNLKPLNLSYSANSINVINNGHTIQVNIADGSTFKIGNDTYKLKQFHFHVPSENNINGDAFPLEAHFVHATDDGKLAVIAVMFKEGEENKILAKIWDKLPNLKEGKEEKLELTAEDIKSLMPKNKEYYKFMGSLTTPPCSENVKWHVYKTPLNVSKEQVIKFFSQFGFPNNRPIQPSNGREIQE